MCWNNIPSPQKISGTKNKINIFFSILSDEIYSSRLLILTTLSGVLLYAILKIRAEKYSLLNWQLMNHFDAYLSVLATENKTIVGGLNDHLFENKLETRGPWAYRVTAVWLWPCIFKCFIITRLMIFDILKLFNPTHFLNSEEKNILKCCITYSDTIEQILITKNQSVEITPPFPI